MVENVSLYSLEKLLQVYLLVKPRVTDHLVSEYMNYLISSNICDCFCEL
jgi:hypothetical protein